MIGVPRAQRPVFEHGDWVQVYVDPDPAGGPGYVRIEERHGAPGVAVLPLHDGDVGLVTVHRRPLDATVREIPRGFGGEGTGPRSDAVRELREESGIELGEAELVELGSVHPDSGISAAAVSLFAAPVPDATPRPVLDTAEVQRFDWYPADEVFRMIDAGELTDGFTCAALLRAAMRGLVRLPGQSSGSSL